MNVKASSADVEFKHRFESGEVPPCDFHHRDHLRLAYVYLCETDTHAANERMRRALKKFLKDNDVSASKYHETLTYSWVQAVKHFMAAASVATSFDEFISADDRLLETDIMFTHYERSTLFSDQARSAFVQPDIQPIPQHT